MPLDKETKVNKKQILDDVMKKIEKQFGKGSVMRMGEKTSVDIEVMPTGCLSLDMAIGVGGLPKGRIIEIYGPESSGKTTFALSFIASCQKLGGVAAFIDAEHALDPVYARNLGVNLDDLLISQPDYGEQALEIVNELVLNGADIVVIDSVAALVPKSELDGDMEQQSVGAHARLMSKVLRKITASVSRTGCIVIFINQTRMKIGIMFGNPETTTGGNALKFFSSVRMEVRKVKQISGATNEPIGAETKVKIVKNKVSAPFREFVVDLMYGKGIQKESEIVNLAEQAGIFEKSGSWYSYNGERISQGKENLKSYIHDHSDFAAKIEKEIRARAAKNTKSEVKSETKNKNSTDNTTGSC